MHLIYRLTGPTRTWRWAIYRLRWDVLRRGLHDANRTSSLLKTFQKQRLNLIRIATGWKQDPIQKSKISSRFTVRSYSFFVLLQIGGSAKFSVFPCFGVQKPSKAHDWWDADDVFRGGLWELELIRISHERPVKNTVWKQLKFHPGDVSLCSNCVRDIFRSTVVRFTLQ